LNKPASRRQRRPLFSVAEQLESRAYLSALTFAAPVTIPINGASTATQAYTSAVTGDFNGDGKPDFAVINTTNNTVDVMLNNGNDTFTLSQQLPTGRQPGSLQVAALSTGGVNLLFVNSLDGTVEYYSGNGTSAFNTTPTILRFANSVASGPVTPDTVRAADVNGDGLPDLIIGTPSAIITFINAGTSGFNHELAVAGGLSEVGTFVNASTVTDAAHVLLNGQVQIYLNAGSALALNASSTDAVPGSLANSTAYLSDEQLVVGDFNNDGNADLATIISDSQTNTSFISVMLGNGDGTFATAQLTPIPFGATALAVGSFTSSGNQDLLALYSDHSDIFTGKGDGTFTDARLVLPVTNWSSAAIADFNGDGTSDVIVNNTLLINTTGLAPTTSSISSTAPIIAPGTRVTLKAAIAGRGGVPTGTVEFVDETTPGSPKVLATTTLRGGKAVAAAGLGGVLEVHRIVAEYSGDTKFAPSTSPVLLESVEKNAGIPIGPTILTPTVIKETVPALTPASTKLTNASVTIKLTNSTGTDASGQVTFNVYAAPTTTLDTSVDTLVASIKKSETVKHTKTTTLSIPIKTLPPNLIGGSFHLIVQTVDPAGSAAGASTQIFSVAAPFISLSERVASLNLPATVTNGEKLHSTLKLIVTNGGNITNDDLTVDLSASSDSTLPGPSFLPVKNHTKIAPGKSISISIPIKNLPTLAAGSYFLVAQTTDANEVVTLASAAGPFTVSA